MSSANMSADSRFPIGDYSAPERITRKERREWIRDIAECPAQMRSAAEGLSEAQLDTPYREGGWTVRQVVHHVPDSHINSYVRFRLALTENEPVIKPFDEARWAELGDARMAPIEVSLRLLEGLHERWVRLLESLSESDFKRAFIHPERGRMTLEETLALYSWHSRHHVAHINALRARMGW
jgi:uncharacterized damage-inducible protein DinB